MIRVTNEIGKLKQVILHRPGSEIERLTPLYLEEMLFEDIPWLRKIQEEHDQFASVLRTHGCTVHYYEQLLEQVLSESDVRSEFVDLLLTSAPIGSKSLREEIRTFLLEKESGELASLSISGIEKNLLDHSGRLSSYITEAYPFYIDPLTNLYFTRDPGAVIGRGVVVSAMKTVARRRESLLLSFIHRYHPLFLGTEERNKPRNGSPIPLWYTPEDLDPIEGGDILVLTPETVAVGCSARTTAEGIERLATRLFLESETVREVLVLQIPFVRAYMHLDTVLTMVDRDALLVYPGVLERIELFRITPSSSGITISRQDSFIRAFERSLRVDRIRIIESGGPDALTAAREQWNDSTNSLALEPGVIVTYDRNVASNETLRAAGMEVVEIAGSELVRGRGGPRCMSMPIERCAIDW